MEEDAKLDSVDKQQGNSLGGVTGKGWLPGNSGNPKGRPKDKKYISEALKDLLASDPVLLKEVVESIIKEAKRGNVPAFKEITDRTEGKVAEKLDVGDVPVTIILKRAEDRDAAE